MGILELFNVSEGDICYCSIYFCPRGGGSKGPKIFPFFQLKRSFNLICIYTYFVYQASLKLSIRFLHRQGRNYFPVEVTEIKLKSD